MRHLPAVAAKQGEPVPVGHYTYGGGSPPSQRPADYRYDALLVSQGHKRIGHGWSGGGPFYCEHADLKHTGRLEVPSWFFYGVEYGPTRAAGVGSLAAERIPSYGSYTGGIGYRVEDAKQVLRDLQANNYAKGIGRTRPGNPEASLGVFLNELRDFPAVPGKALLSALRGAPLKSIVPAIRARFADFLGASASEYLNWEFGWSPFVGDLRKFYRLAKTIDQSLAKLIAENDRNIRRRTSLGTTTTVEHDPGSPAWGPWPAWNCGGYDGFAAAGGWTSLTAVTMRRTKTWFVAGYRYHIPNTASWAWKGRAVATLFGAFPTPLTLYQAIPWTWLVDWFSDLSDLVGYFSPSAVDNLVTRYAFTMRHVTEWYEWVANTKLDPVSNPVARWSGAGAVLRSLRKREILQRGAGWAPFGTSLQSSQALSPRQLAILAALGISRVAAP